MGADRWAPESEERDGCVRLGCGPAAFLQSMVVGNEVSNLEYYCFDNEEEDVNPDRPGWPGPNTTLDTSNFITYNRAVRKALDDIGGAVAAVKLVGTDFFPCQVSLDGVKDEASIDSYDCHHYGAEGYTDFAVVIKPPLAISHAANKKFLPERIRWPLVPWQACGRLPPFAPFVGRAQDVQR